MMPRISRWIPKFGYFKNVPTIWTFETVQTVINVAQTYMLCLNYFYAFINTVMVLYSYIELLKWFIPIKYCVVFN